MIKTDSILVIEDNKDVSMMLYEVLADAGYEVKTASTGLEGLYEIKRHTYDLVLLDLMLPFKSGDEILREMRSFSDTPVIIISAKDLVNTKIDLLKLGADDYIIKQEYLFGEGGTGNSVGMATFLFDWNEQGETSVIEFGVQEIAE